MNDVPSPRGQDGPCPFISIVVACLNNQTTLRTCLQSVIAQRSGMAEIILIDGGSTDGTVGILEEFQSHLSYWVSEPDGGIYQAWNKALDQVRGEWVLFLGADDMLWSADVLEKIEPSLRASGDHAIVYGRVAILDQGGHPLAVVGRPWLEVKEPFFAGRCIPNPGVFYRTRLFAEERFDTSFRITGDYDFLARVLSRSDPGFAPDVVVAGFRAGGVSTKPAHLFQVVREIDRLLLKNGHGRRLRARLVHRLQALFWMTAIVGSRILPRSAQKRIFNALLLRSARGA
jgi:glycosyltransferase involved in cell wall biosynthesis